MVAPRFSDEDFEEPPKYVDDIDRQMEEIGMPTAEETKPTLSPREQATRAMDYLVFTIERLSKLMEHDDEIISGQAGLAVFSIACDAHKWFLQSAFDAEKDIFKRFEEGQ